MRVLLQYLAIANLLDGITTFIGLKLNLITESNPLMDYTYSKDPLLFISVKIMLSFLLYGFVFLKALPTTDWVKGLAVIAAFLYTIICMAHMYWIVSIF